MNVEQTVPHRVMIQVKEVPGKCREPRYELVYSNGRYGETRPYHTLFVKATESIEWKCDHTFTINFGWQTPMDKVAFPSQDGTLCIKVPDQARNGQYKYFIAVWYEEKGIIVTDDPEVIIKPGGDH